MSSNVKTQRARRQRRAGRTKDRVTRAKPSRIKLDAPARPFSLAAAVAVLNRQESETGEQIVEIRKPLLTVD